MTNIIRHAQATRVQVVLKEEGETLALMVEDNGTGFNVEAALRGASEGSSLGLLSMQERISLVEGRVDIHSELGRGTRINVTVPLNVTLSNHTRKGET
jgi:signal transduction histidine kinase